MERDGHKFEIQEIPREEYEAALALVWRVFLEFEAPDYTEEGVLEFDRSIHDETYLGMLRMYGAFIERSPDVVAPHEPGDTAEEHTEAAKGLREIEAESGETAETKQLAGVIATRSDGSHIALFFVDGRFQRVGIGRMLFEHIEEQCTEAFMTVNSSPFAVPIYHCLGFEDTDVEQVVRGLRFTPMEKKICVPALL